MTALCFNTLLTIAINNTLQGNIPTYRDTLIRMVWTIIIMIRNDCFTINMYLVTLCIPYLKQAFVLFMSCKKHVDIWQQLFHTSHDGSVYPRNELLSDSNNFCYCLDTSVSYFSSYQHIRWITWCVLKKKSRLNS